MSTRLLHGDCREVLKTLPSESVHCVVTSPPYFGLRDYGTGQWTGGDSTCAHLMPQGQRQDVGRASVNGFNGSSKPSVLKEKQFAGECGHCGARRTDSQIGLEATPDAFVAEIVAVFREVRRVLRNDGTLWLNLGDSYGAQQGKGFNTHAPEGGTNRVQAMQAQFGDIKVQTNLAPKNLIGIPWRVAFALQADGWILRQDIIWSKPNPMPESVRDRCTKAHEYLFLLSKSPRYFYDAEAIAEQAVYPDDKRRPLGSKGAWQLDGREQRANGGGKPYDHDTTTRNKRSVWEVATQPFSEAHFATFPPALIEPCILAGCPHGGIVLDPFAGAGTTGLVADRLGRNAILIELNADYADMSQRRITDDAPLFAEVVAA